MRVALGDLNNDTLLDIVVVNSGYDSVSIFLGCGNGSISNQTTLSTGNGALPSSVALGDLNNDGMLDIVVVSSGYDSVGIFLGYGNGSFANQTMLSTGAESLPSSVAFGDLNNDTILDIVVANSGSDSVGIFLGYGNGSFAHQTVYSTGNGSGPVSVALGDLNNDTALDFVVTYRGNSNVGIFLGYGDASFTNQMTYSTALDSDLISLAVGDFNNDHVPDVLAAGGSYGDIALLHGSIHSLFVDRRILRTGKGSRPRSFAIGDFNKDGHMDFCVASFGTGTIGVFLGYGNFSFADQAIYSTGNNSHPYSLDVGDFNGDTILDIVVAIRGTDEVAILLGFTNGSFGNPKIVSSGFAPCSVVVGDFNNDSLLDIVFANHDANNLAVLLGNGSGSFVDCIFLPLDRNSRPFLVMVGDFNGDNKHDLAVANEGIDSLNILLQTC